MVCESRLNTQEKKVLSKLDDQDLNEMMRRAGLKHKFDRQKGLVSKDERKYEPEDLETDYTRTYKGHYNYPQRESRRPLLSPRDEGRVQGDYTTQTRKDFTPKQTNKPEIVKKREDNYKPSSAKVEGVSQYQEDYPRKWQTPQFAQRPDALPAGAKIRARFDGRTMHKEHYKSWVGDPSNMRQFRELPAVVDHLILPKGEPLSGVTETAAEYPGKVAPRPEPARPPPANLGVDGDFDHLTVNRDTYKSTVGKGERAKNYRPVNQDLATLSDRPAFAAESHYMHDYGEKQGGLTSTRDPMLPMPNNINIDPNAKGSWDTWQKAEYRGHDVRKHQRPKEIRYDHTEYIPPTQAMDGNTGYRDSYTPKNISEAYNPPKRVYNTRNDKEKMPKFDGRTMHNEFYTAWPVQTRERFGDFLENSRNLPLQGQFYGETTTGRVYVPKEYRKTEAFIPEQKPIAKEGDQDFNTVHRITYKMPKYKLSEDDYQVLQNALKKVAKYGSVEAASSCKKSIKPQAVAA